jgi:hypothetical protein
MMRYFKNYSTGASLQQSNNASKKGKTPPTKKNASNKEKCLQNSKNASNIFIVALIH